MRSGSKDECGKREREEKEERGGEAVKKENWMGGSKRGEGMRKGEEKEGIGLGKRMRGRKGGTE